MTGIDINPQEVVQLMRDMGSEALYIQMKRRGERGRNEHCWLVRFSYHLSYS